MEASFLGKAPRFLTMAPPRLPFNLTYKKALSLDTFPLILYLPLLLILRLLLFLLLVPSTVTLRHFCRPLSAYTYISQARSFLFISRVLD